jgi:tetratricopeptide (TPR) repeat protein
VWIVAGYSGENDPVFDHLAKIERYDNGLYWICYNDNPPQTHVQDRLLVAGKDCFCLQGFDADDFFVTLAQGLECFPPDFVQTPFTHLENLLEPVVPYSLPGNNSSLEAIPKKLLQDAIEKIEKPGALALRARDLLLTGNFKAIIEMEPEFAKTPTSELADLISWGYVLAGNKISLEAETNSKEEADRLWALAGEQYEAALKIKPDRHEALYNWGSTLDDQARTKSGEEADQLWGLAGEKYEAALKIEPDKYEAFYNWGVALEEQARTKGDNIVD